MNKVYIIGNLSKDVELNETQSGIKVARFSVAVTRKSNRDEADFFNVVAWRATAELCSQFLKKGSKVAIDGTLQNRSYETQSGETRTITEIIAENVEFLSSKPTVEKEPEQKKYEQQTIQCGSNSDDLPF